MYIELETNDHVDIFGKLSVIDQDGREVEDPDIIYAARAVYDSAGVLINDLLIPGLNDVLYRGRKFPLKNQEVYEEHGYAMMRAAYKVAAYSGLGKVKGKPLVVYPVDPVDISEGYYGLADIRMHVRIEEL